MSKLILWKNQEMDKMKRDIDSLFKLCMSGFGGGLPAKEMSRGLSLEMTETEDALVVTALVPGVEPEDIEIRVRENFLTIRGQKRRRTVESGQGYYRKVERMFGTFSRSVRLPRRVREGEITATLKNGVLRIVMPKWEPDKTGGIRIEFR